MNDLNFYGALAGGLLIGAAAALLLWLTGRIAGVSGIAGRLWSAPGGERLWRWLFLAGLVAGAALYYAASGRAPAARPHFPPWLLALAGLLVGFGSSLGGGCTSGHGVCGLGRFSPRSLAAVLVFLGAGVATTFALRHLAGVL